MIIQKNFLVKIKEDFMLNIYEAKIWTALLSRGMATAGELADISGVPRSRCYDVLENLEKKGFILMKIGKPIKYIVVHPDEVTRRVKKTVSENAEVQLNIINKLANTDVFRELDLLYKNGIEKIDSAGLTTTVEGKSEIYSAMKKMLEKCKKEAVISTTKDRAVPKLNYLRNTIRKLDKNGIKIKIVAPLDPDTIKKLNIDSKNVEFVNKDSNFRFVNIDDNEFLFMMTNSLDSHDEKAIIVKSKFFVKGFNDIFNRNLVCH